MKRGAKVAVCHDGKWGRRVEGVVVQTRNGHHIKVRFQDLDGEPVEFWARKHPAIRYWRKPNGSSVTWRKRAAYFAGWAESEYFCPWFAVYKWKGQS